MGRLKDRYDEWEKVMNTPFILGVIRDGYKLLLKRYQNKLSSKITNPQGIVHNLYAQYNIEKRSGSKIIG